MCPDSDCRDVEFDSIRDLPDRWSLDERCPVERIVCTRIGDSLQANVRVECETATERFYRMSPCGFEFGYRGSGPHALAWNILGLLLPPKKPTGSARPSKRHS